jgi:ABC-type phosphate transport system substrate-binding protein
MRLLLFTKIVSFCFFAHFVASAEETRMAYSDLIPNELEELLYEDTVSLEKNLTAEIANLSVIKSGTLPMIEDFLSNRLDICIVALPEASDFPLLEGDNIIKIPFAYKSSVVVVNAENPISEITIDQLATIFGTSSTSSNLLNWRDFGMTSFSTSTIKAYAVKEDHGISTDLFRYHVLNEKSFNPSVTIDVQEDVQRLITQDKAAVGVFPKSPENPNLKVLFVAQDYESIAYGPSMENIYYSDYPIRLPFYIVYNVRDSERLYPLINTLLSDSIADILDANDFFSLPKVIREKLIIDLQLYLQENEG